MRIREVEKATGLTAKAIRLYESKGLIAVARQSENDYRDYTPEDVERLKTIAVLRKLEIPVPQIRRWCDGEATVTDLLHGELGEAMLEARKTDERLELTRELLKILEEEPEKSLQEAIDEARELQELYQALEEIRENVRGDLFFPLFATIIALGPVGWTVLRIVTGQTEQALVSFGISLLVVPYVFYRWFRYFNVDRSRRKIGCLWMIPVVILVLALGFGSMFFVVLCQERLYVPEEGFYVSRWVYAALLYPIVLWQIMMPEQEEAEEDNRSPAQKRKDRIRMGCVILVLTLVLYYGCVTAFTGYSEGVFTRHSFFCPMGKTYTLSDVEQVEAGFYGRWNWLPWKGAGEFYYKITYVDGTSENWTDLTRIGEQESDPWLDLLELDEILMDAGVKKVANWENRDLFGYDPSCLEICDAILGNP